MKAGVVLLGAPGAGKGTQAQRVCAQLGLVHLSTGDLLRAAVAAGTATGQQAKRYMDSGRLVPDEVVTSLLFESLDQGVDGFLLDGFPRNLAQARDLDARLADALKSIDVVIDIEVLAERLVARITGRRICRGCGRNYHVEFVPPATEGRCDACQGELYQRTDDIEAVVEERVSVYAELTRPLIDYYTERGLLVPVDGDRAPDLVTEDILAAVSRKVPERA